jgi:hypothetical protein
MAREIDRIPRFDPEARRVTANPDSLSSCGMAGAFGYNAETYEVSTWLIQLSSIAPTTGNA